MLMEVIVKKFLLFILLLPATTLIGMDSKYTYTKDTCNLDLWGKKLTENDDICKNYSRREVFLDTECIGSVAYNKNKCTINALYIHEENQGKGLGKILFLKALKDLKNHGCQKVTWTTTFTARGFYEKLGAHYLDHKMYIDIEKDK